MCVQDVGSGFARWYFGMCLKFVDVSSYLL